MTYLKIKKIYEKNQQSKDNTYLVPAISFDEFVRDELMFVRHADENSCTVWRSMNGKLHDLSIEQIKKIKCVGNCSC
jgi:hypothetical protein